MPNEKDAVANFLNGVTDEKELFQESDEAEDTKEADEEVVEDEKPLPFHKDPKVQRYIEKQIAKAVSDTRGSSVKEFKQEIADVALPSALVKLVGNDTPEKQEALKEFSQYLQSLKGEAVTEFRKAQEQEAQAATAADVKAQEELDNYFDEIEETYNVDLSSNSATAQRARSEFIAFVRKIAPKDADGEVAAFPDLVASYEEFQERSKRAGGQATRAKALSSRSLSRSSDAAPKGPTGSSWKDVERHFAQLKNQS